MSGAEIMTAVAFFLTVSGALWAIWWRIEGRIKEAKAEGIERASLNAAAVSVVQTQLADHKLHVAETYVSKAGHRESTEQVMDAIHAVKSAIDGTNQRIDRMWESQGGQQRASRSSTR